MTSTTPDEIAACVLDTFASLPRKYKPRQLADGRNEWVPLAGIVLSRDHGPPPNLLCAALATGMKCLPKSKLSLAKGNVLHDWHAEVLALRAFNRFVIDECAELARTRGKSGDDNGSEERSGSVWVKWTKQHEVEGHGGSAGENGKIQEQEQSQHTPPFTLQPDVKIHMYCSEAPCGDASMELTMAEQDDATPWSISSATNHSSPTTSTTPPQDSLLGRGHFDRLGIVRRKPSRPDAPSTTSKSCTDKLAMKQCTGLLSGPASLLIQPGSVYLDTIVLPESQTVPGAVERAWGSTGRMSALRDESVQARWRDMGGFQFRPFEVKTTKREFEFSRRRNPALGTNAAGLVPSNLSAMCTPRSKEMLINGVLQGRKQLDVRGASCVSRRLVWKRVLEVAVAAGAVGVGEALRRKRTYGELKDDAALEGRERVKREVREMALKWWVRNEGDEQWMLEGSG